MRRPLRAHEEAVLLSAGTRDWRTETAARLQELLGRVAWPSLLDELARQRLVPLLGARILDAAPAAPEPFVRAVEDETRAARAAGELGELVTLRIAAALEAAGIPNVPLKGPLLARALHGDTAMRASRDVDVLVARGDLARSAAALAALGWRVDPDAAAPLLHLRLVSDAGLPDVEVHWRLHWYEDAFAARALARAVRGPDGVRRLIPEDDLVALLLFHARDGFAGLRHAIDVAAWYDRHGAGPEPLLGRAIDVHAPLARALTASALVLDQLVGIRADALVAVPSRLPRGVRQAVGLANPLMRGSAEQITAEVSFVDGLVAPRGRRRAYLRRRALPSPQSLPRDPRDRPLGIRRAEHLARLVARCAIALVRRRPALR